MDDSSKTIMYMISLMKQKLNISDYIFDVKGVTSSQKKITSCFNGTRASIPKDFEKLVRSLEFRNYLQKKVLSGSFINCNAVIPKFAETWLIDYAEFIRYNGYSLAPIKMNQNKIVLNERPAIYVNHYKFDGKSESRTNINSSFRLMKDCIDLVIDSPLRKNQKVLTDYGRDFKFGGREMNEFVSDLKNLVRTREGWQNAISFLSIILGTKIVKDLENKDLKVISDILFSSNLFKSKIFLQHFEEKILSEISKTDFLKDTVNKFKNKNVRKKKLVVKKTGGISVGDMIGIFDPNYNRFIYYIVYSARKDKPVFVNIDWTLPKELIKYYGSRLLNIKLGKNISEKIESCENINNSIIKDALQEFDQKETYQYFYVQSSVFDSKKKFPKKWYNKNNYNYKLDDIKILTAKCYEHNQKGETFVVDIMKLLDFEYELNEYLVGILKEQDIMDYLLERSKSNILDYQMDKSNLSSITNCNSDVTISSSSPEISDSLTSFSISNSEKEKVDSVKTTGLFKVCFNNLLNAENLYFFNENTKIEIPLKFEKTILRLNNSLNYNQRRCKIFSFFINESVTNGNYYFCHKKSFSYVPIPVSEIVGSPFLKIDIDNSQTKSSNSSMIKSRN